MVELYQRTQAREVVPEFELFDLGHVTALQPAARQVRRALRRPGPLRPRDGRPRRHARDGRGAGRGGRSPARRVRPGRPPASAARRCRWRSPRWRRAATCGSAWRTSLTFAKRQSRSPATPSWSRGRPSCHARPAAADDTGRRTRTAERQGPHEESPHEQRAHGQRRRPDAGGAAASTACSPELPRRTSTTSTSTTCAPAGTRPSRKRPTSPTSAGCCRAGWTSCAPSWAAGPATSADRCRPPRRHPRRRPAAHHGLGAPHASSRPGSTSTAAVEQIISDVGVSDVGTAPTTSSRVADAADRPRGGRSETAAVCRRDGRPAPPRSPAATRPATPTSTTCSPSADHT